MPRKPRTVIAGYPNYIALLSNKSIPLFKDDMDRENFLNFVSMARASTNSQMKIYAYVLMEHFVHMIALPQKETDVSKFVQNLGRRYVRYYNQKYDQSGPLFETRFKNFVISMDERLFTSIKYLEAAPLRQGLAATPGKYAWSSFDFRAHGLDKYGILAYDPTYMSSGVTAEARQEKYRNSFPDIKEEDGNALSVLISKGGIFADKKSRIALEELLGYHLTTKNVGRPNKTDGSKEDFLMKKKYKLRKSLLISSLVVSDLIIIMAVFFMADKFAIAIRNTFSIRRHELIFPFDNYKWIAGALILVAVSLFSILDLYTNFVKLTKKEIFLRTGRAILLMGLTLLAVIYTTRLFNMSRLVLVLFVVLSVVVLSSTRILMAGVLKKYQGS